MRTAWVLVTRLGQMHFVAQPHRVAFAATARLGIRGRDDALLIADGWSIAPAHLFALLLIMLSKDLAQEPHFWQAAQPLGGLPLIKASQQVHHILPHLLAQLLALRLGFGKARQFKAMHIAIKPLWVQVGLQPLRLLLGESIERRTHTLPQDRKS